MPNKTEAEEMADQLLSWQRVILACTAIGVNHDAVRITDRAVQSMVIRGLIAHKGSRYVLTETGRAVFDILLERGRLEQLVGTRVGGFVRQLPGREGAVEPTRPSRYGSSCTATTGPAMTNVRDLTDEQIIDALRRAAATWWRDDDIVLLEELVRRFRRLRETHPTRRTE
jgi:hypothetical protein